MRRTFRLELGGHETTSERYEDGRGPVPTEYAIAHLEDAIASSGRSLVAFLEGMFIA